MVNSRPLVAVLDDEAKMRVALMRLLGQIGYEVVEFESGRDLLDACHKQVIQCIILDLHMPGMNGFAVLEALALLPVAPPVIVISGHDQTGNAERINQLGARAYFTKPVDKEPLLRALGQLAGFPERDS